MVISSVALKSEHLGKPDLSDIGTFKFWRLQKPHSAKLLKEIIFRWRGASAYVSGSPGRWVVWPRERWGEWTGLSRNQLDRALRELDDQRLINREQHRFAGSEVRTFLRPTLLALQHMGRPQDITHATPSGEATGENTYEEITEKTFKETSEKSDYTSFTSSPKYTTKATASSGIKASSVFSIAEEKGSAEKDDPEVKGVKDDPGLKDKLLEKSTNNLKNANQEVKPDEEFPELKGPHEKSVTHPSKKFPNWSNFSPKLQSELYLKYQKYVDNWYKGHKGKQKTTTEWTAESEADFQEAMKKLNLQDEAGTLHSDKL